MERVWFHVSNFGPSWVTGHHSSVRFHTLSDCGFIILDLLSTLYHIWPSVSTKKNLLLLKIDIFACGNCYRYYLPGFETLRMPSVEGLSYFDLIC